MDKNSIDKIERFRRDGKRAVDWIADYLMKVDTYDVQPSVKPGDIRAKLDPSPPARGEMFEDIVRDLDRYIVPGIMHWQSPRFFGYFPASASGPSTIGDLISSGLGVQGMLWSTSPSCTELESHVLDWLVDMLDLPSHFKSSSSGGGVIQDTASSSTLCAILAAREKKTSYTTNLDGPIGDLTAYTSCEAHSSIEKAIKIAGIGSNNLRQVSVDENQAVDTDELNAMITNDIRSGKKPFFINATVGTTSTHGIDDLQRVGEIAQEHGIWLHIDAAMAGTAAICDEFRYIHRGIEHADSYTFNPHKWMLTNFDCSVLYIQNRDDLIQTLSIMPEYLRNDATEKKEVIDYRDWQIPLGRRFRSLKLWMVIRSYGVDGIKKIIREHIKMTRELTDIIRKDTNYSILREPDLNLICIRHRDGNARTKGILRDANSTGKMLVTHTVVEGQYYIRICIGQEHTTRRNVTSAWKILEELGKD